MIIKGDIFYCSVLGVGKSGDFFMKKDNFNLFLKMQKNKSVAIGKLIKVKVVKLFPKLGYVELIK